MTIRKTGFVFLIALAACRHHTSVLPEAKTAKTVPANYVNATDNRFNYHQDTLYYGQSHFTGLEYALYPSKDTAFVKSYWDGLEEGWQKKWYPNKQLTERRFYISGKKEGPQEGWWPDGKQKFTFMATDDAYTGELKEWNMAGLLYKDFHYTNGQEEGSEKLWWDNGTIRANYVIIHGKRYGLLGIKVCANPYDSILKK